MKKEHSYTINLQWTGNKGEGTRSYQSYDRSHTIKATDKEPILCSSDPAFRGDAGKYNPEELFVAAIANCHMLWFLHLAANAGIVVVDYSDQPVGTMIETENGGGHFVSVTLYPVVTITNQELIEKTNALHHQANQYCFIANSCNFPIQHQPACKVISA